MDKPHAFSTSVLKSRYARHAVAFVALLLALALLLHCTPLGQRLNATHHGAAGPVAARPSEPVRALAARLASQNRRQRFAKLYETTLAKTPTATGTTVSGPGSTVPATRNVRRLIAAAVRHLGVRGVVDVGCGDAHWQRHVVNATGVAYLGVEIVERLVERNRLEAAGNMSFAALDVVAERVPPVVLSGGGGARLVVLRDVVQHLPLADGVQAIANIEATSGAEYLLTNWHHHPWTSESEDARYNAEVPDMGDWFPVDVFVAPFNFSRPIMWIREGWGSDTKVVGLWRLPALFRGDGRQLEIEEADWTEAADRIIVV